VSTSSPYHSQHEQGTGAMTGGVPARSCVAAITPLVIETTEPGRKHP
jgi:hypothetical protein